MKKERKNQVIFQVLNTLPKGKSCIWFSFLLNSHHLVEKKDDGDSLKNSVVDDCVEDCPEMKS